MLYLCVCVCVNKYPFQKVLRSRRRKVTYFKICVYFFKFVFNCRSSAMKFQFNGLPAGRSAVRLMTKLCRCDEFTVIQRKTNETNLYLKNYNMFLLLIGKVFCFEKGSYILQKCIDFGEMNHVSLNYFKRKHFK